MSSKSLASQSKLPWQEPRAGIDSTDNADDLEQTKGTEEEAYDASNQTLVDERTITPAGTRLSRRSFSNQISKIYVTTCNQLDQ